MPNATRLGTFDSTEGARIAWRADGPPPQSEGPCGLFLAQRLQIRHERHQGRSHCRPCRRQRPAMLALRLFRPWRIRRGPRPRHDLGLARRGGAGLPPPSPAGAASSSARAWAAGSPCCCCAGCSPRDPDAARRISGLVLLAPALDMTRALIWARLSDAARQAITARGYHLRAVPLRPRALSLHAGADRGRKPPPRARAGARPSLSGAHPAGR